MSVSNEDRFVSVNFINPINKNSEKSTALIDTGADITCISERLAQILKLKPIGQVVVSSPSGMMHINKTIVTAQIEGKTFKNIEVCVIPHLDSPLIGWDIIKISSPLPLFRRTIFKDVLHILDAIPNLKEETILILGQDTTEIHRLREIQRRVGELGYSGIIVKDIVDIEIQSIEEKVTMLASLCRFIICENSTTSGHIDELKIAATNRFVTAIIQQEGTGATWMQADYDLDFSFMSQFTYSSLKEIDSCIDSIVEWAEKKVEERKEHFNKLYRWR